MRSARKMTSWQGRRTWAEYLARIIGERRVGQEDGRRALSLLLRPPQSPCLPVNIVRAVPLYEHAKRAGSYETSTSAGTQWRANARFGRPAR